MAKENASLPSLFEGYTQLDNGIENFQLFNNRENYQISIYIVPSFRADDGRFDRTNAISLAWMTDVTELLIADQLFSFGITGSMTVVDNQGNLSYILEQGISYEVVVNIVHKISEKGSVRYEPYVFKIVKITEEEVLEGGIKTLRVQLEDVLTSEAKKHSVGTLIKYYPDISDTQTFPALYVTIYEYLATIIRRHNNEKIDYGKKIRFNTYPASNESSIIKPIFDNIDPNATIFELLTEIGKSACVEIKPEDALVQKFEMIGNVLVPLFFREEYPDMQNFYYSVHGETPENFRPSKNIKEALYVPRPFTLRNFYTPFTAGFEEGDGVIFESFTTSSQQTTKEKLIVLNGSNVLPIRNIKTLTTNSDLVAKHWKNLAFISSGANGGGSRLVFFHWFYEFFNQIFLRDKLNGPSIRLSNVLPQFYLTAADDPDLLADEEYAEQNSTIVFIKNEKDDPVKEILMQIGKAMASLVFLNNLYTFEVEGNLLRRPNEVINLYTPSDSTMMSSAPLRTDFQKSDNVMLYATEVLHLFHNTSFTDKIVCNRIYEKLANNR